PGSQDTCARRQSLPRAAWPEPPWRQGPRLRAAPVLRHADGQQVHAPASRPKGLTRQALHALQHLSAPSAPALPTQSVPPPAGRCPGTDEYVAKHDFPKRTSLIVSGFWEFTTMEM